MISKSILSKILIVTFICGVLTEQKGENNKIKNTFENLSEYTKWKIFNQRIFLNDDQKVYRQAIFLDNLEMIKQHNADPNNTYKMALTPFSDMTEQEFSEIMLNQQYNPPNQTQEETERQSSNDLQNKKQITNPFENISKFLKPINQINESDDEALQGVASNVLSSLPTVDWRTKGAVTEVKNQGACGSSWAFSASGLMESFNFIKNKSLKSFSEQQLVDCVSSVNGFYSNGCKKGWPVEALHYSNKFGLLQSHQYAYTGVKGTCKVSSPTNGFKPNFYYKIANSQINLQTGLNYQPISVLVDASKWAFYGSGIFNDCSTSVKINHAVLAVGYDSAGNWLLKNSWSTGWGERGYMKLKAGNNCGILTSNYFILE